MTDDPIITVTDARQFGYCVSGIRDWFKGQPAVDFRHFLKHGYPASVLAPLGPHATRVIDFVRDREAAGGR